MKQFSGNLYMAGKYFLFGVLVLQLLAVIVPCIASPLLIMTGVLCTQDGPHDQLAITQYAPPNELLFPYWMTG